MTQSRTLLSVRYLRGVAALAVAATHTGWTRTTVGAAGMDLFFVISGFIIVLVGGRGVSPAAFLRARAAPLCWLLAVAAFGVPCGARTVAVAQRSAWDPSESKTPASGYRICNGRRRQKIRQSSLPIHPG